MFDSIRTYIANRMNNWGLLALALCVVALVIFGEGMFSRLAQIVFLVIKLSIGGFVGYWISKAIFRDVRPANLNTQTGRHYMYYRAIVVAGAILGAGFAT